jgi:hypothetical protein
VPAVDLEQFYDQDERRRRSAELELGTDWTDGSGVRYELSWVEDTGELYVMREPIVGEWPDPFGGVHVEGAHHLDEAEQEGMVVSVVGIIADREEVERILEGWEDLVGQPDSVAWLVDRLRGAGVLSPEDPSSPRPS